MNRFLLVLPILFSGWVLLGTYIVYEYGEYGAYVWSHLLDFSTFKTGLFHVMILTAPIPSTVLGYFVDQKIKLTKEMKLLEGRYRDYYDNAPHGYHSIGGDTTLLDVNDPWLKMLGYEKEEVVGRMKVADLVAPGDMEVFEKYHPVLVERGRIDGVDIRFRKRDGSLLPVRVSSTAVYDGEGVFVRSRTIVEDNTERKDYECALKAVAEEWSATFDAMPWGVMLLDEKRNVVRANEYAQALMEGAGGAFVSARCSELVEKVSANGSSSASGSNGTGVLEGLMPETGRHYRLSGRPVALNKSTMSYIVSLVDVTDIRRGEKKLVASRDAFFNMLKDTHDSFEELNALHSNLVLAFANAIDAKSPWTKGHSERVSLYAVRLAQELGLRESRIAELRTAALLHDVGKIGTYDYLLDKKEPLTSKEFENIKKHPENSARILEPIGRFRPIIEGVRFHHEHYDGKGYPRGLRGENIPLMARILCIADSYDSMTANRPYRPARGREYAVEEFRRCSGTQFDPKLVEVFLKVVESGEA
jgi:PAS domain S-box-containing protein/putative nucleotidyltransferase with HDIG domain